MQEAGLQEVDAPFLEVVLVQKLHAFAEPQVVRRLGREHALVPQVVDREQGARALEQAVPGIDRLEVERQEGGVPVVRVDDVGRPLPALRELDCGAREDREAQVLVGVLGVDRGAGEQCRAVDEPGIELRPGKFRMRDSALERAPRGHQGQLDVQRREPRRVLAHPRVQRQNDANVVPRRRERAGQCGRDVGEAAGLRERRGLPRWRTGS
jgi:hypothetical protein